MTEPSSHASPSPLASSIARFATLALDCVHRPYPNQVSHLLRGDEDVRPPRELTPAFYGCFDWHSAVHGHWLLAVAAQRAGAPLASRARRSLSRSLTEAAIAREVAYLRPRPAFERPYGLAWLCALHARLHTSNDAELAGHARRLQPLVEVAVDHLRAWLPKLTHPVRSGVHSQTAFSLGLLLDWARACGRGEEGRSFETRARALFADDRDYAPHLEPGGEDFLSPSLGAADLMRRVSSPDELAAWLDRALPQLGRGDEAWLQPAVVTDRADGRLAHLDGLNLSRAWMLLAIAAALPAGDSRVAALQQAAERSAQRGLASVDTEHYAGSHWLGTFAAYLLLWREGDAAVRPAQV